MSTALRVAARELLRAYEEWIDTAAVFPSVRMLDAIDALQEALAELPDPPDQAPAQTE